MFSKVKLLFDVLEFGNILQQTEYFCCKS